MNVYRPEDILEMYTRYPILTALENMMSVEREPVEFRIYLGRGRYLVSNRGSKFSLSIRYKGETRSNISLTDISYLYEVIAYETAITCIKRHNMPVTARILEEALLKVSSGNYARLRYVDTSGKSPEDWKHMLEEAGISVPENSLKLLDSASTVGYYLSKLDFLNRVAKIVWETAESIMKDPQLLREIKAGMVFEKL